LKQNTDCCFRKTQIYSNRSDFKSFYEDAEKLFCVSIIKAESETKFR
jgi:hypothetical protein